MSYSRSLGQASVPSVTAAVTTGATQTTASSAAQQAAAQQVAAQQAQQQMNAAQWGALQQKVFTQPTWGAQVPTPPAWGVAPASAATSGDPTLLFMGLGGVILLVAVGAIVFRSPSRSAAAPSATASPTKNARRKKQRNRR